MAFDRPSRNETSGCVDYGTNDLLIFRFVARIECLEDASGVQVGEQGIDQ